MSAEIPHAGIPTNSVIAATRVVSWPPQTAYEFLQFRFPENAQRIAELVATGEIYDATGQPITTATPFEPGRDLYLFRDPPGDEPEVPELAEIEILHRDDNLLVIDKPHRVAVIPRGRWITQTALVYLRNLLDLPQLSPVHRLDRPTAGVLVFAVRPEVRGVYQMLFQDRQVNKEYLAVTQAPASGSELATLANYPLVVRSRIVKQRGIAPALEVPGEPNAETTLRLLDARDNRALWSLQPKTGKTHQLRLHLNSIGLPILGDPFWPTLRSEAELDDSHQPPLQLLAKTLEFIDPITGEQRRFESRRRLFCWE